ncbi:unnamed protein product, partial [Mesorhabditis belari]|uniref:Uncharacterized protein n=1 Tax=Mesorhabditis belari TaxID=2138241 RepID=A0AAF3FM63_9BILA
MNPNSTQQVSYGQPVPGQYGQPQTTVVHVQNHCDGGRGGGGGHGGVRQALHVAHFIHNPAGALIGSAIRRSLQDDDHRTERSIRRDERRMERAERKQERVCERMQRKQHKLDARHGVGLCGVPGCRVAGSHVHQIPQQQYPSHPQYPIQPSSEPAPPYAQNPQEINYGPPPPYSSLNTVFPG